MYMQPNTFHQDLITGQKAEALAAEIFISKGFSVTASTAFGYFPDYDMAISQCPECKVYFIEVKDDAKAESTGNVAIELFKRDSGGLKVDSGLSATKSTVWLQRLKNEFYGIPTKKLIDWLNRNIGNYRQIPTNDRKELALIPIQEFTAITKILK